jgi:hypothetical protein
MYGDANLPTTISVASSTRFESDILGGSSAKAANDRPTTTQIVKIIRISYVAQQSIDNGIWTGCARLFSPRPLSAWIYEIRLMNFQQGKEISVGKAPGGWCTPRRWRATHQSPQTSDVL